MSATTTTLASPSSPPRTIGTMGVFIAGVALVVSASTFVSDFTGFLKLGGGFAIALLLGLVVILPAALAAADLTVSHPRAGGIYQFARSVLRGRAARHTALFLSLCFFGTFLFGAAGETMAGAHALRALVGGDAPAGWFVPLLVGPAIAANLCGLRSATWLTGALLVLMLGVRWFFGLAGFLGWADTGPWHVANLAPAGGWHWFGRGGILAAGVALGFWSFVGIEGAASLVEETKDPHRAVPRGIVFGLAAILITTLVMGIGAVGTRTLPEWQATVAAADGESPHLAVGAAMFGETGRTIMAAASVAATWSTLLIAFAAVPRMICAVARDGMFFGSLSTSFAQLHPRTGVPVRATLLVVAIDLVVTLCQGAVVDCLYAAAYLWFFRYLVVLVLAGMNRMRFERVGGFMTRRSMIVTVIVGGALIVGAWYWGFAGAHVLYGTRALAVVLVALACATLTPSPAHEGRWAELRVRMPTRSPLHSSPGRRVLPASLATGVVLMTQPLLGSCHSMVPVRSNQLVSVTVAPETTSGL